MLEESKQLSLEEQMEKSLDKHEKKKAQHETDNDIEPCDQANEGKNYI